MYITLLIIDTNMNSAKQTNIATYGEVTTVTNQPTPCSKQTNIATHGEVIEI